MKNKKIIFLSGTRADFGKIKPLIEVCEKTEGFESHIFVTGMHMLSKYGDTYKEIERCGYRNIFKYYNHDQAGSMERMLSKTIEGFSLYTEEIKPDLVIVHGDRVEALAGSIVGSLQNIRVVHIEGGEISGTIDESIRHAVSKMSHIHLVSNESAKTRLLKLGEMEDSIKVIGSPDIDIMLSNNLPSIEEVKSYYEIPFDNYFLFMYHPVTTDNQNIGRYSETLFKVLDSLEQNVIAIYPNNDLGSEFIIETLKKLKEKDNFRIFPSLRFEYFLTLLKHTDLILGNSSAGIREAPIYNVPTVNIGSRQNGRSFEKSIFNCEEDFSGILATINKAFNYKKKDNQLNNSFGNGSSAKIFHSLLQNNFFFKIPIQKQLTY